MINNYYLSNLVIDATEESEKINKDLLTWLLNLNSQVVFTKLLTQLTKLTINAEYGNYIGEIYERFDQKGLVEDKDITTLLFYLAISEAPLTEIFLYNQKDIFQEKVVKYLNNSLEQKLLFISLKEKGYFKNIEIQLFEKNLENDNINMMFILLKETKEVAETVENSWVFTQLTDYIKYFFDNHLPENLFSLNYADCLIEKLSLYIKERKEFKKYKKFVNALGNFTNKRLETIFDFYKGKVAKSKVLLTLLDASQKNNFRPFYELSKTNYEAITNTFINVFFEEKDLSEESKIIFNKIKDNYRLMDNFNGKKLSKCKENITSENFLDYLKYVNLLNNYKDWFIYKISIDYDFAKDILDNHLENDKVTINEITFELTDIFTQNFLVKSLLTVINSNKDKEEDIEKYIDLFISFVKNEQLKEVVSKKDLIDLLLYTKQTKSLEEYLNIFSKVLTAKDFINESITNKDFFEDYFVSIKYLDLDIFEIIENMVLTNPKLSLYDAFCSQKNLVLNYLQLFDDEIEETSVSYILKSIEFIKSFKEFYEYESYKITRIVEKIFKKLINLTLFKESFANLSKEDKVAVIDFCTNFLGSKQNLPKEFKTQEENDREKMLELKEHIFFSHRNYIEIYNKFSENDKKLFGMYLESDINILFSELERTCKVTELLKVFKIMINEGYVKAETFWNYL